ncbi:hypothetical protein F7725_016678, partial [Dissostichus mawsoni]
MGVVVSGGAEQEGASWVLRLDGAADAEGGASEHLEPLLLGPGDPKRNSGATTAAVQQQQSPMASTTACTEAVPLVYPQEVKNDSARKAYKLKLLKDRPETLFADLYKSGEVSNLIFLTDQPLAWHAAISAHYPSVKKEGICNGWKIKIKEVEDPDTVMTTVNMYKNGTVMVQGNLTPFELDFLLIKERAQQEKSAPTDNNHTLPETDTTPTSGCPAADPEEKEPTGPEPAQDPQLDRAITDLKVKFTELERELPTAQDTRVQQDSSAISTELTKLRQDRDSNRRELSTVRTEVRELQQDRESHMARLTALTEEVRELREERRSYRRELTALSEELQERERVKEQLDSHPDHNQNPVTPIESSQNPPTQQPPSTPSSISSPHANPTPRSPPITQMNTTPSPQTNTTPHPSRPAQQRGKPDIVILIDSNGKFIDENKLFPTHTVAKIWHPTGPPPRQHPWRQDHPHLLPHHAPLRSHQGSYDYPQARPEPLLSPGVPPQPQRRELHPDPLSYAQAVKRTAGPTLTTTTHVPEPTHTPPHDELRDIQQMLSLFCSHLIGQVRELQQDRESHMARLTALTEEVRELREERRSYRRELTALSEELQERERVKEQLDSHPDHNQNPVTPIESSQNPPTQQPPSTPSSISSPHANPTPRSPPITQMNTTPSPQTNTTPHPSRPAQQRGKPDIGSYDYPQARPEPLLSPGVPPQPQRRELHPDPLSYAQAVKRTAGPTLTTTTHVPEPTHTPPHDELRDIQQMLSLLCSHLIG